MTKPHTKKSNRQNFTLLRNEFLPNLFKLTFVWLVMSFILLALTIGLHGLSDRVLLAFITPPSAAMLAWGMTAKWLFPRPDKNR